MIGRRLGRRWSAIDRIGLYDHRRASRQLDKLYALDDLRVPLNDVSRPWDEPAGFSNP